MSRIPPPKGAPSRAQIRPGVFVYIAGERFVILPHESTDTSEVLLKNLGTDACKPVKYTELLLGHDDATAPLFAPSEHKLQALIDARTTPAEPAPGRAIPQYAYDAADRALTTTCAVDAIMEARHGDAIKLGIPFEHTKMLQWVCGTLPDPISLATYYNYKNRIAVCKGDRVCLAASFQRKDQDTWKATPQQLYFIDSLIARYYTRHERPQPATILELAEAHLDHTQYLWPDPKLCSGLIPRNLVCELLDRQIPMEAILANREKVSLLQPISLPSRSWMYRYLKWFRDQPDSGKKVLERQLGKGVWEEEHVSWDTFVSLAQFPLDIVVADHWLIDVFTVDEATRSKIQRLWLTVLIDVFTRCVIGFALLHETPRIESIQSALRHAMFPKTSHTALGLTAPWECYGIPLRLSLDNAWCHHSHSLERLANGLRLGGQFNPMALLWRPPYKGRYGNVIESLFGNFSNQMKLFLPGAIRASDPKSIRNAMQDACLLYRDVYHIIHQVILRYLHTPHSALHGMTPHEKWMAGMRAGYPLVPPLTPGVDRLFWRMHHQQRIVTEHGIALFGLHYTTTGLHREVGKDGQPLRFDISYDVTDISRLALFRGTTFIGDIYAKELKLADRSYLQMSLAEHEISKKLARTDRHARQDLLNHRDTVRELARTRRAEKEGAQAQLKPPRPKTLPLPSDEDVQAAQAASDTTRHAEQHYNKYLSSFSRKG